MLIKRHKERLLTLAVFVPVCCALIWLLPHAQTTFVEESLDEETLAAAAQNVGEYAEDRAELTELAEDSLETIDPYTYRNQAVRAAMLSGMEPLETEDTLHVPDMEKLLDVGLLSEPGFEGEEAVSIQPIPPEPPMPNMVIYDTGYYELGESGTITAWDGRELSYTNVLICSCTAYTTERQSNKITATGTIAHVGGVAVDPTVIRYGTEMYIVAEDGSWTYGYARAEDCGGGIKGNKIDLFMDTYDECIQFGVRPAYIYILG